MDRGRQIKGANEPKDRERMPTRPDVVSSEILLGRAQELHILHEGREYRLRRTRNGRLILTA